MPEHFNYKHPDWKHVAFNLDNIEHYLLILNKQLTNQGPLSNALLYDLQVLTLIENLLLIDGFAQRINQTLEQLEFKQLYQMVKKSRIQNFNDAFIQAAQVQIDRLKQHWQPPLKTLVFHTPINLFDEGVLTINDQLKLQLQAHDPIIFNIFEDERQITQDLGVDQKPDHLIEPIAEIIHQYHNHQVDQIFNRIYIKNYLQLRFYLKHLRRLQFKYFQRHRLQIPNPNLIEALTQQHLILKSEIKYLIH